MSSILNQSGVIHRLAEHPLNTFGPGHLPYTMGLVIGAVLQSIFLDVLLVISAPLARKLAPKIGQLGTARMPTAPAFPPGPKCPGALKSATVGVSVASVVAILLILPMRLLFLSDPPSALAPANESRTKNDTATHRAPGRRQGP